MTGIVHPVGARLLLAARVLFGFASLLGVSIGAALAADERPPLRIVAFGDSLMAGYQIALAEAFPAKLEQALRAKGHAVDIANAGVSGHTTAAGLARIDWAVPDGTDAVILEFGANDMLRGQDTAAARRNLDDMITRITAKGAVVLLAGMRSVDNWGADYSKRFEAIYPGLARQHQLALYPFFLDGVTGRANLTLPDALHPNPRGVDVIVAGILPMVETMIARLKANPAKAQAGAKPG